MGAEYHNRETRGDGGNGGHCVATSARKIPKAARPRHRQKLGKLEEELISRIKV
jgi:hypothetical protein